MDWQWRHHSNDFANRNNHQSDHVLVLAEMPGVGDEDVKLDLAGDILTLHAERGSKKYHKEIVLPREFKPEAMERTCHNGVLEVKLKG